MTTARLVPSTIYNAAGTTYLTVSDASNMYTNTDSSTYGTVTNINASTSSRYVYLRGFNFDDIPSSAVVSSFSIKLKASESNLSTSTNYRPRMCNGTTTLTGSSSTIGTSASVITFTSVSADWATISGYGDNFGIRINVRRNQSGTEGSCKIYGAEIEVNYTVPVARTVTTTLTGSGTIDPSGTETYYDDDTYNLVVTPTNASDTVTATKNGSSISLTQHTGGSQTESKVLGTYTLISGGFNGQGATYFQGLVGKGHNNTQTTSNYYSSGNGTIAVFTYAVPFTDIPSNATITDLYVKVNGHAESTSQSSEYMCVQLKSGNTELSTELNFKSIGTSNSEQTLHANVTPTIAQLENLVVQCRLGYYGGAINGATVYLEYEVSGTWYTWSTTISGDMTIAVTIGSSGAVNTAYLKVNGSWQEVTVYKKVNGSWQQISDPTTVINTLDKYILS